MKKRILSAVFALLFVASLPVTAFAEEYDLAIGEITVEAKADGQYVTQTNNPATNDGYKQTTATVITQKYSGTTATPNTVTIKADAGQTANVTLSGVSINTNNAAVSTSGAGDVVVELNGTNKVTSGTYHAGVEKNNDGSLTITAADNNGSLNATGGQYGAGIGGGNGSNGSNITITGGTVTANGGKEGAGIGGGAGSENDNIGGTGSNITITGGTVNATGGDSGAGIGGGAFGAGSNITISDGKVTAKGGKSAAGIGGGHNGDGSNITVSGGTVNATGGDCGAGIGGGMHKSGSNITVSGDAQVKVQGGKKTNYNDYQGGTDYYGAGAPIGNGGKRSKSIDENVDGAEVDPGVSKLTTKGKIEYYAPDVNMNDSTTKPTKSTIGTYVPPVAAKAAAQTVSRTVKLYSVVDKDGREISYKTEVKDGVLTVTVDADYAVLTGTLAGISALTAQGIKTVVFITSGATSSFDISDLSAKGGGTYKLTHVGATVTFTLDATDISEILK